MKDVLILGGGVIGLSVAVELACRGLSVQVLDARRPGAASTAAAGMLAPDAEGLSSGPLGALGRTSRALWSQWQTHLESLTGSGVGYWPSGILCPTVEVPSLKEQWWDRARVEPWVPGLGEAFVGAFWHPEDGQVDPRRLVKVLEAACIRLKVTITAAVVDRLEVGAKAVQAVHTDQGSFDAGEYVLCSGSWSAQLLALPVFPVKGQMLALQMPEPGLKCVVFGPGAYLVPRRDGRLVVGATQEQVGFLPGTTDAGLAQLLVGVKALLPEAATWPILETWYGYRPATPDAMPILGAGPHRNLWLATGHHRNGILLSPVTATLLADAITGRPVPQLEPFSYTRFCDAHAPLVAYCSLAHPSSVGS
ncbi:glycine oxidase ThiO [Anthocerotibacter panamensis]|uniref:glycine oxidase ThiO n=1 Tax=Anthocerotibacter panamensis TaxID=2857077 RepID=UPI001C4078A2|nr:glycine oxidase ThiO [Anthocerotibacter panamensis]